MTFREANTALRRLPDFAKSGVQQVMDATAFQVQRRASELAPRKTGRLQLNVRWQSRPRSLRAVVGVDMQSFYWKFVEYGTVHAEARPFMRPAAMSVEHEHQARLIKVLTSASDQMASGSSRFL